MGSRRAASELKVPRRTAAQDPLRAPRNSLYLSAGHARPGYDCDFALARSMVGRKQNRVFSYRAARLFAARSGCS